MGKYDNLIGGFEVTLNVNDVLAEQTEASNIRRNLVEQLIKLTEEDIEDRNNVIFQGEDWAKEDIEYLQRFLSQLKEYLQRL